VEAAVIGARAAVAAVALLAAHGEHAGERFVVGSKAFPESWVLGEALAALARASGADAAHRANLGGTEIVAEALRSGAIDAYPEYTGTLAEVVLHAPGASLDEMRRRLAPDGLGVSEPLGFDDSYALAVGPALAERDGLRSLSDAARHKELRAAFTHEFLGRSDGWPGLRARYGLAFEQVAGMSHELAFEALASGQADVVDVYTTDPHIERLGLRVLDDDRGFFPRYDAVVLYRLDLAARAPATLAAIRRLAGRVTRTSMARANAAVAANGDVASAASRLLRDALGSEAPVAESAATDAVAIGRDMTRHIALVAVSVLAAILVGIPLGILAARRRLVALVALGVAGVLQTIPSLALLALLIPVLGIGARPAIVALLLYGLLPIVQGTYTGLTTIPGPLLESAEALGLPAGAKLARVELPLAAPSILAGIRTSAVIAVGTATVAALVGAGGLGDPILRGITLRSVPLILSGAVPAALLALAVQALFAGIERAVVSRGITLRTHGR
jgi:osmoprotectant transport system permease protein